MSYILEALKKSDKKRQQETSASPLHKIHAKPPVFRKKEPGRGIQTWLTIILAILLTGLVIWYLTKKDQPTVITEKQETKEAQTLKAQEKPEVIETQPIPELKPAKKKVYVTKKKIQPEVLLEQKPHTTVSRTKPQSKVVLEPKPLTPVLPQPQFEDFLKIDDKTPYLEELAPSFQETVPQFQLDGHVFSPEPLQRMIMINNKIMREGEIIEKDFILDEITPSGIILRYGTERFQMKAF